MAWGKRYIDQLFSLTLPALLAPYNLPALAAHFACEMVVVTEEAWFARLRQLPVFHRLEQLCTVELRSLDDLISCSDAYGMALTYALFRGFEDLGPDMVEIPLVFFNADFVLADGSLRSIGEKILAGERLILAPSYCVTAESVAPWLASRRDADTGTIAVPPREMAEVAIRNRHNTIRGKTVNQRVFSVEWMDQFYWLVDEQTLIAHQMPFAVVAMQPERVVTEMRTFWDYGIISEACPTTPRCVIADSDQFLMIELRSADTARDQLRLGWPEPKQIAEKIARFVTKDPIELARHTLVLHASDLPSGIGEAKARLDNFVQAVLAELPREPIPWINHPIWAYHYPGFHRAREAYLARRAQPTAETAAGVPASDNADGATVPVASAFINRRGTRLRRAARQLYYKHFGKAPWLRPLHPRWADSRPVVKVLRDLSGARIIVVSSARLPERLFGGLEAHHMSVRALDGTTELEILEGNRLRLARHQVRKMRIAGDRDFEVEIVRAGRTTPENVKVRSLELDWDRRYEREDTQPNTPALPTQLAPAEKYNLCILELKADDLLGLASLLSKVRPWMEPQSKIMVFHLNTAGTSSAAERLIENDALWLDMPCRIHFAGSQRSLRAANAFYRGVAGLQSRRLLPAAKGLAYISAACLGASWVNKSEPVHSRRAQPVFTSFTLEIDLTRAAANDMACSENARDRLIVCEPDRL